MTGQEIAFNKAITPPSFLMELPDSHIAYEYHQLNERKKERKIIIVVSSSSSVQFNMSQAYKIEGEDL